MPNSIGGPLSSLVRLQALTRQLNPTGEIDRLPSGTPEDAVEVRPVTPDFPVCNVTPPIVPRGGHATVDVEGLLPNRMVKVILGDVMVGSGNTDGAGVVHVGFTIPFDSAEVYDS